MIASKFPLGQTVITSNASTVLTQDDIVQALTRHIAGDWGDMEADDWQQNDQAVEQGSRLLSVYRSATGIRFWVITEHDRSVTTILLPEDY